MSAAQLSAALVLSGVLAIAGAAKLVDLEGSRRAAAAFGLPPRLARPIGLLLPIAELATAAMLLGGAGGSGRLLAVGALAALVLLAAFCAAVVVNLIRGRAPDCHCFGRLHSAPVSERTLARNGVLVGLAAFVAAGGSLTAAAAAASAVGALAVLVRLRSRAVRQSGPGDGGGLPLGGRAPDFELPGLDGSTHSLGLLLRASRPLLLVFTDPDCGPCAALAPEIAAWQRSYADELTIAVIERRAERAPGAIDPAGRRSVLLQHRREIADRYLVDATPSAILISPDGTVESRPASGGPAIRALMARRVDGLGPSLERPVPPAPATPAGRPLHRRELIVRAAAAWAAASGAFAAPAWAARDGLELNCRFKRCGDRCCPKKATCERRGKRKVCVCPDGRPACRDRCCPESFVCRRRGRRRRCVCPDGYIVCSGRCVRVPSNPYHCGQCGRGCPTGTSCVGGECVGGDGSGSSPGGSGGCDCPPGKACCEGRCTDLNTEAGHCGECGHICPAGEVCCEGSCRNVGQDHDNCGRCGRRCASDEVCSHGECRRRCRNGLTDCAGSCVDTTTDPDHCGGCAGCTGPFDTGECCNGTCCDYNADTCCAGGCRNLALDDANCGACGNACPPDHFCRFGTCSPF